MLLLSGRSLKEGRFIILFLLHGTSECICGCVISVKRISSSYYGYTYTKPNDAMLVLHLITLQIKIANSQWNPNSDAATQCQFGTMEQFSSPWFCPQVALPRLIWTVKKARHARQQFVKWETSKDFLPRGCHWEHIVARQFPSGFEALQSKHNLKGASAEDHNSEICRN